MESPCFNLLQNGGWSDIVLAITTIFTHYRGSVDEDAMRFLTCTKNPSNSR
jgi:hypothetical protein